MKKVWSGLVEHWKDDFRPIPYITVAFFLIVMLSLNYYFDFEDGYLDSLTGLPKFAGYFLFYSIPYFFVLYILGKGSALRRSEDLFKVLFALLILSLDASVPFVDWLLSNVPSGTYIWAYKVTVNAVSSFTVVLPLLIYYKVAERDQNAFYGLTTTSFDIRPYLMMLTIMFPLIVAATTNASFLKQYPMYRQTNAHEVLGVGEWVTVLSYEVAYGFDFVTVELLFRGFFVIGMMSFLGRRSVLAMAVIYCMLHFGKPAGEAVSSIFGGYILGVIAYQSGSIWGGVLVHLGIAWMMEIVAAVVKYYL